MSPESNVFRLREEGLEWRLIEGEIVALDVEASNYLAVNRSAALLWPALVRGASRDELARQLVERFGIEQTQAEQDLDAFLTSLEEQGLLEGRERTPS